MMIRQINNETNKLVAVHEVNATNWRKLATKVSEFNCGMTPEQVQSAWISGNPVYTSFNHYEPVK